MKRILFTAARKLVAGLARAARSGTSLGGIALARASTFLAAFKRFAARLPTRALIISFLVSVPLFAALVLATPRFSKPLSFAIYDRSGRLLGAAVSADDQWRFAPGAIPDRVATALVTFEDRRFYLHPGVDPLSLARAVVQNVRASRVVSGGSTLTMQTVRLSMDNPPRTIGQKAREAVLAFLLEARYTKREILSLYAASAPFGGNVVGLEAASWRYFNRPPENLTWAEAATLAVLPNQPSMVHPSADRARLLEKRDRLLRDLCTRGKLTRGELALSLEEPLPDAPYPLPRLATHYLERMRAAGTAKTFIDRKLQISTTAILERWSAQFCLERHQ